MDWERKGLRLKNIESNKNYLAAQIDNSKRKIFVLIFNLFLTCHELLDRFLTGNVFGGKQQLPLFLQSMMVLVSKLATIQVNKKKRIHRRVGHKITHGNIPNYSYPHLIALLSFHKLAALHHISASAEVISSSLFLHCSFYRSFLVPFPFNLIITFTIAPLLNFFPFSHSSAFHLIFLHPPTPPPTTTPSLVATSPSSSVFTIH